MAALASVGRALRPGGRLLLPICTGCSEGEADPLPPAIDNSDEWPVLDVSWEREFQRGGEAHDTALQMPGMIAANDSGAARPSR